MSRVPRLLLLAATVFASAACAPSAGEAARWDEAWQRAEAAAAVAHAPASSLRRAAALAFVVHSDRAAAGRWLAEMPQDGLARYDAAWLAAFEDDAQGVLAHAVAAVRDLPAGRPERAAALVLLRGEARWADGYETEAGALFDELTRAPAAEDPDSRDQALWGAWELARDAADAPRAAQALVALGVLTRYRVSAPWSAFGAEDFDVPLPPERGGPLPEHAQWDDAGLPVDVTATARQFSDGELFFADVRSATVGYGEAAFATDAPGTVLVRLETPRAARVWVDERPVVAVDFTEQLVSRTAGSGVTLAAGLHRVLVKLAQPGAGAWARVQVTSLTPGLRVTPDSAAPTAPLPTPPASVVAPPPSLLERLTAGPLTVEDPERVYLHFARWYAASRAPWVDDAAAAEEAAALTTQAPRCFAGWELLGLTQLDDESVTDDVRRSRATASFAAALRLVPGHAPALFQAASVTADEGRRWEALGQVDQALTTAPRHPGALRLRLELLTALEAEAEAAEAYRALVDGALSPAAVATALAFDGGHGRAREATALLERWRARAPGLAWHELADLHTARGDYAGAAELLAAAAAAQPESATVFHEQAAALRRLGDARGERELVADHLRVYPRDLWARERLAERLWLDGAQEEALAHFRELLGDTPDVFPVRALLADLVGPPLVAPPARATADRIREYEEARTSDPRIAAWDSQPGVTVLQDAEYHVLRDGSWIELRHEIRRLQSKALIDQSGEMEVPEGAVLLEARTLRADGSTREPELGQGKRELSFSGLASGDYIELRILLFQPSRRRIGGTVGSVVVSPFGLPTFALRARILTPAGVPLQIQQRHGMPAPEERRVGDEIERRWVLDRLPGLQPEPLAPPLPEFVPHAVFRVGVEADEEARWADVARFDRAQLRPLLRPSPELRETAARLAKDHTPREATRAAFLFARDELLAAGPFGAVTVPASATLAARSGNPTLALLALLRAQGSDPALLLCHPEFEGLVPRMLPTPEAFDYPVLRLAAADGGAVWMDVNDRFSAFDHLGPELAGARCLQVFPRAAPGADASVALPADAGKDDGWRFALALTLAADGSANGALTVEGAGRTTAALRKALSQEQVAERRVLIERWLAMSFAGVQVGVLAFEALEDPDQPLRIRATFRAEGVLTPRDGTLQGDALVPLALADVVSGTPALPEYLGLPQRRLPLRLQPFHEVLELAVAAPPGARFTAAPPDYEGGAAGVDFRQHVETGARGLVLRREVRIPGGRVAPADFPAFSAFVQAARGAARAPVRITLAP